MSGILSLSKRQPDLLKEAEEKSASAVAADNLHSAIAVTAIERASDGPYMKPINSAHELQTDLSLMKKTIGQWVDDRRLLAGNAQAEHTINELYAAANINRGPSGAFQSSRLHFDMLIGRDEQITPADYLNFEYNYSM
uniref:SCP domain-containing protein n=1 Tax=Panagrellus redivivus TaxID=6233 RepID=A0A7E4UPJ4_PANRE